MGISALLASQILDASATGRSVLTGADASAIRTTLGLGTLATQSPTGTPSASTFLRGDYSWQTIDLSGYVPYSGATGAVNLGANDLQTSADIVIAKDRGGYTTGNIFATTAKTGANIYIDSFGQFGFSSALAGTSTIFGADPVGLMLASSRSLAWTNGNVFGVRDTVLARDGAGTLGIRNSTNAQRLNLYGTYTDASNYRRLFLSSTTAGAFTLGVEGAGTGASGNTLTLGNPVSVTGGTITASTPALNVTQTWNNAATTFTGILANVTDTASNAASLLLDLQVGGSSRFRISKSGNAQIANGPFLVGSVDTTQLRIASSESDVIGRLVRASAFVAGDNNINRARLGSTGLVLDNTGLIRWTNGSSDTYLAADANSTIIISDAANTLAQRNSTNAQTFRIYNTFTDASNYERAKIAWESNILRIGTEKAGTGSARALELQTDGVTRLTIASTGLATFSVKGVFTGAADCLTLVRTGLCSFSLGDANGDTFRIQNAGDSSDMLRIHGTTKLVTIYGNLDVGTRNIVTDTTTGTKIGTATNQKLGFYNATPVVQPTAVADATDAASVITQLNALLSRMRDLGLIAT